MRPSRRYRYVLLLVASCVWLVLAPRQQARCEEYKVLPVDKEIQRRNRALVFGIVSSGSQPLAGNEQEFDRYFVRVIFPLLTQKEEPEVLAKRRRNFLSQFMVRAAARPAVYTRLRGLVIQEIPKLVRGNFHPAVRYNATLILADLDQRPGRTIPPRAPIPDPQALVLLMQLYDDEAIPDAVKVGCLLGMQRHATYGDAEKVAATVTEPMRKLAGQKKPPEGRDPSAHTWMRRMAMDVLATLAQPGEGNETTAIFVATLKDETAPTKLRCAAAEGLGKLKYANNATLDVRAMTFALVRLAVEVLQQEMAISRDANMLNKPLPERQRLVHRLKCVQSGLQASRKLASDADKQLVGKVAEPLDGLITKLEKAKQPGAMDSIDLATLTQELATMLDEEVKTEPAKAIEEVKVSERDGEGRDEFGGL